MKIYFLIVTDDDNGSVSEYHSSIAKAKKARTNWKKNLKNTSGYVHTNIFKAEFKPTKQGFIRYLNSQGGIPINE
jgi:hypothetical protein